MLIKVFVLQARPRAVDLAAIHLPAQHQHHIAVAVVGAVAQVFTQAAAKFAHHHHGDFALESGQIVVKGVQSLRQRRRELVEWPPGVVHALALVVIPAAKIYRRHAQAHIQLDHLRDRLERVAKAAIRVGRRGRVVGGASQRADRFDRALAGGVHRVAAGVEAAGSVKHGIVVARVVVVGIEPRAAQAVAARVGGGDGIGLAQQRNRRGCRGRQRRQRAVGFDALQVARQPAARHVLVVGRAALDIVHRVEVAARVVIEAAGVHNRQVASVIQFLEWRGVWVQAHIAVEASVLRVNWERAAHRNATLGRVAALGDVDRVVVGRDQAQAVAAAAQKHHHQRMIIGGCRAGGVRAGKHQVAHAPTSHRRNCGATAHQKLPS